MQASRVEGKRILLMRFPINIIMHNLGIIMQRRLLGIIGGYLGLTYRSSYSQWVSH